MSSPLLNSNSKLGENQKDKLTTEEHSDDSDIEINPIDSDETTASRSLSKEEGQRLKTILSKHYGDVKNRSQMTTTKSQ